MRLVPHQAIARGEILDTVLLQYLPDLAEHLVRGGYVLVDMETYNHVEAVIRKRQVKGVGQPEFEVVLLKVRLHVADCRLIAVDTDDSGGIDRPGSCR